MTVPIYQSFAEAKASTTVREITIDKPTGVVENDLIVAIICTDYPGVTVITSSGWNVVQSTDTYLNVFYKVAGGSEGASYIFSWSGGSEEQIYGFIMRITGHDTSTPINISGLGIGASALPTCPTVTTTKDDCLILRIFGADHNDITVDDGYPADTTGITVDKSSDTSGSCSGGAAWKEQANAGASGTAVFSLTASEQWVAITVAIQPTEEEDVAVFMGANF